VRTATGIMSRAQLSEYPSAKAGRGWRIPVAEIERAVVGAVKALLDDRAGILTALQESAIENPDGMDVLKLASDLSLRLASETESALTDMTGKVQLTANSFRVDLKISLPQVGA
jgi:hypothetical protein